MEKKKLIEQLEKVTGKKVILIEGNDGDLRIILPKLVSISNNSRLTQIVAKTIVDKFDAREIRDFIQWLHLVK